MSLCVVVCCYTVDRWAIMTQGIDAAATQLAADDQILVVVDHNTELRELLRDQYASQPQITIIDSTGSPGLSGARNTALSVATSDVLVYLDDDAVVENGGLEAVRSGFTDDAIVALGGAVTAVWESGAPRWFPDEFGWVVGCDYRGMPGDGARIRNPIGAAMAVRRAELNEIGGFDERLGRTAHLPAGCEETLMGIELSAARPASTIRRHTGFQVRHHVEPSRGAPAYFLSRCHHEGRSKATLSRIAGASDALSSGDRLPGEDRHQRSAPLSRPSDQG